MAKESEKELTKEGFERLLTKAAQPIRKQPSRPRTFTTGGSSGRWNFRALPIRFCISCRI